MVKVIDNKQSKTVKIRFRKQLLILINIIVFHFQISLQMEWKKNVLISKEIPWLMAFCTCLDLECVVYACVIIPSHFGAKRYFVIPHM